MRTLFFAVMIMVSVSSWGNYGIDEDEFNYGVGSGNAGGQGTVQQPAYPNGGQGGN